MNLPPKVLRVIAEDKREYRHWHLPDIAALVKGFPGSGVKRVQELLRQGDRPYRSSEVIRQKACSLGIKCGTFNPKALAVLVLLSSSCITRAASTDDILDAIQRVETGGHENPSRAVGDGGRSLGPLQIQRAYWQDSGVPGRYEQVRDEAYARRVVIAYARRYEPAALRGGDAEVLARCHNGGPGWRGKRKATDGYWHKVRREMR